MSTDSNDEIKPPIGAMQQYTDYKKRRELWGQALIKDRKTLGMNQTQFAEALSKSDYLKDISQQAVARWEAGAIPRKETYDGLCKLKSKTRACIHAPQATAPQQLPHSISPLNHPYSRHAHCRPCPSIRNHRKNMVPLAKALTQYAAICAATASPATCNTHNAQCGTAARLTVTPQLA